MRFIPAVSGVQIPPLLPEHDRKPGISRASFAMDRICRASALRDDAPSPSPAHLRDAMAAGGENGRQGIRCGNSFIRRPVRAYHRWSRDDREIPETLRKGNAACFEPFSMHPLQGSCPSFPGENTEKPCQRRASPVNASLRCGKFTDALRQGSSAGQSMRFIPAASGVQIPPLLPTAIKKPGEDPGLFYCRW